MRAAPEGEAAGAKTRRRRPKAGQRRPKAGRRVRRQDDGAGKQGSDARKRGGDRFLYLFQKIFNAGGARKRRGSARRRKTAPKTRRRFEDGAACRFPSPRRRGSGARRRGGDRFLYLFQKIFNAGGARKRRGSARRRGSGARKQGDGTGKQGGGGQDKATAHKDVTAAIAFYIFFKNFSIPRKRRGEHPAF